MFYHLIRLIGKPIFYLLFWPKIISKKNVKIKGKAVIISNHVSNWDPLFIAVVFRRHIFWMGKVELFKSAVARFFLQGIAKAFPVRRGEGDLAAIRHSFRVLREGKLLGIFPEGKRNKTGELGRFEPGTSMIALKNDAPIVPLYIKGRYKLFRRMKLTVGEPFRMADYVGKKTDTSSVEAATRFLENKLKDMRNSTF